MSTIRVLSDHLISQIAAGEVVERPSSVVKELLENALDADARSLEIDLEGGGSELVRVRDDGRGMSREDALLAFERHATSKIREFDDLQRIRSLGFRGAALASIAAVARVELRTAVTEGDGHRIAVAASRIEREEPTAHSSGTTLEVRSLFFNVPARREFLKSAQTELRRSLEVVQGYALARPDVRFRLTHGDRVLLDLPPAEPGLEGARSRISGVFGGTLGEHLVEIQGAGQPNERIWGFVGDPSTTRGRRRFVYINGRLVRDRGILAIFYRSVRNEWKRDDFPALFLFVDLASEDVDVNVHPQKAEVRFRDGRLLGRVEMALREALARGRGEEITVFEPMGERPRGRLVWEGSGQWGREGDVSMSTPVGEVGEDLGGQRSHLPGISYTPAAARPVPLSGKHAGETPFRLLGQYKGTILILEGPDGLYLVDQHVAHERVLYERIRAQLESDEPQVQQLLTPMILETSAEEAVALGDLAPTLEVLGFHLSAMSGNVIAVSAAPAGLRSRDVENMLLDLAKAPGHDSDEVDSMRSRILEVWAANSSCRAAVKMHHPLGPEEMTSLMSELFECDQPYACPHGRPIVLRMTDFELEKRFERR